MNILVFIELMLKITTDEVEKIMQWNV